MESSLPSAILQPRAANRIVAGHPWVYAREIARVTGAVADGNLIQVRDPKRRFLGVGLYNSRSTLRIRILGKERFKLNRDFFDARIARAVAHRRRWLPEATSLRLVNSEADGLSGLIVDRYEDVLVLQTSALGMDQRKGEIAEVLGRLIGPRAILERNDFTARQMEGLPLHAGLLEGKLESEELYAMINGLTFAVDPYQGQKTGLYLDQQENYRRVAELTPNTRVLDAFCFNGGFAIHAARAGAVSVHGLDQSTAALEQAQRNAEANGVGQKCSWEAANAFDWLREQAESKGVTAEPYDVIILDPPSFTRSRRAVQDALRGYKEIHLRAFKLLRKGGLLVTFCCSHHVDAPTFQQVILEAAIDAGVELVRVATYMQSRDHPVVSNIPETEYLKGLALEVR